VQLQPRTLQVVEACRTRPHQTPLHHDRPALRAGTMIRGTYEESLTACRTSCSSS
jgi:hypothetical protein